MSERFNALAVTKALLKQPGTWMEFYTQAEGTTTTAGDRYARNRANMYRIYVKRHGYPIRIAALRQTDGLIHCWGRWNEGEEESQPPKSTGP